MFNYAIMIAYYIIIIKLLRKNYPKMKKLAI